MVNAPTVNGPGKWCSSTEILNHQMSSSDTLTASYTESILYLTAFYNNRRYLEILYYMVMYQYILGTCQ